jgi:eukaryotic-like serine/threonine-protein kinase
VIDATYNFEAGHVIGRYELLSPIAKGGMAVVWAARLRGSGGFRKLVAVKLLLCADDQTRAMLFDEAGLVAEIQHPNVAAALDADEYAGVPYLVMEWVDGEPLDVVLQSAAKDGGLPLAVSLDFVTQACRGLHAAHELRDRTGELRGLVHRDVSLQNIMVTYDGTVKLVDFGVATATHRMAETRAGDIKGKISYMAPEQVRGERVDRRTDIFAMGVVLYLLTTGKHPFKAATPGETLQRICFGGPPPPPTAIVPGYSPELSRVVMKALAANRNERHSTARELSDELREVAFARAAECDLGVYLRALMPERIAQRKATLEAAANRANALRESRERSGSWPVSGESSVGPAGPRADTPSEVPNLAGAGQSSLRGLVVSRVPTGERPTVRPLPSAPAAAPPRSRKVQMLGALFAALVVLVAGAGAIELERSGSVLVLASSGTARAAAFAVEGLKRRVPSASPGPAREAEGEAPSEALPLPSQSSAPAPARRAGRAPEKDRKRAPPLEVDTNSQDFGF